MKVFISADIEGCCGVTDWNEAAISHAEYPPFREQMTAAGFAIRPGVHPIVPIMLGDAALATRVAEAMLAKGVYVIGFSFPVVPQGQARIRTQISAAHSTEDLEFAIEKFAEVRHELGL